jgi:hypothetical protein
MAAATRASSTLALVAAAQAQLVLMQLETPATRVALVFLTLSRPDRLKLTAAAAVVVVTVAALLAALAVLVAAALVDQAAQRARRARPQRAVAAVVVVIPTLAALSMPVALVAPAL